MPARVFSGDAFHNRLHQAVCESRCIHPSHHHTCRWIRFNSLGPLRVSRRPAAQESRRRARRRRKSDVVRGYGREAVRGYCCDNVVYIRIRQRPEESHGEPIRAESKYDARPFGRTKS